MRIGSLIAVGLAAGLAALGCAPVATADESGAARAGHFKQELDRDMTAAEGRKVAELVLKKDAAALFSRFTPDMAKAAPEAVLRGMLESAPPGERLSERVESGPGGSQGYIAQFHWRADQDLKLTVYFDDSRPPKIAGMQMSPVPAVAGRDKVIAHGRAAVALIAKRDSSALFALFDEGMAAAVPKDKLTEITSGMFTDKQPLGARIGESVESDGKGGVTYFAECRWKPAQTMTVHIVFHESDPARIAGLLLRASIATTLPPDPHAGYKLKARLRLPFTPGEKWYVFWGGDTRAQNYHVDAPDQRHAFDILMMKDGRTHDGDGTKLEQYYAWNRPLLAPADAVVIEAVDGLRDNSPGQMDPAHAAGNHVLLNLGSGEYCLMAHMHEGSLRVHAGDKIKTGQELGRCGNSGNTSEPHLHIHVQDKPYLFRDAHGYPVVFSDYVSDGKPTASGLPVRGETIWTPAAH